MGANRQVNYTLTLDDQFSAPLKRAIAEIRRDLNGLLAESRRGGVMGGGAPTGAAGASAAVASGARPAGLQNFGAESHLKEIVSRIGYTNRLLERIANQRPGGGPGGNGGSPGGGPMGGGGGPAGGGRTWMQWGQQTRVGGMALLPSDPRRMMGARIGIGVVGAGVMVAGHRMQQEAEAGFASAQSQADIDAAQANARWGSGLSAGGKILGGAAAGAAGGPLGMLAGAAGGAIASVDELAETIVGFSQKAGEAQERLNKISPFDEKRRIFAMAAQNQAADQSAARYRHNSGMLGQLDAERATTEGMAFERQQARERSSFLSGELSRVGGSSTDPGMASKQRALAEEAVTSKQREGELLRQELDLKRQSLDIDIKAAEQSRNRYQADLERIQAMQRAKQEEISDLRRDFGQQTKSQQARTSGIADKLDRGDKLTRSEERFARKQRIFSEDFKKIDEQRGRDAGFDRNEGLRRRAEAQRNGGYSVDQLKGQETTVKARLETASKVILELNADKAEIEKAFKPVIEEIQKEIEKLVVLMRQRMQGDIAAQNASRKAASQ